MIAIATNGSPMVALRPTEARSAPAKLNVRAIHFIWLPSAWIESM